MSTPKNLAWRYWLRRLLWWFRGVDEYELPIWKYRSKRTLDVLRFEATQVHPDEAAYYPEGYAAPQNFTCDMCTSAPRCTLAYDSYNTNGDCLAAK